MNGLTPTVVDILVVAALVIFVIIGAKRGLMRSLLGVAVLVLALLGAAWCASHLTEPICQWMEPMVERRVVEESPLAGLNLHLPGALSGLFGSIRQAGRDFIVDRVLEMIRPIVNAVVYVVVFVLLVVVLKLLSKLLRIVEKLPVIHSCNKIGGALLGLLSGITVVFVALWAAEQFNWLPAEMIQSSYVAKFFTLSTWMHSTM